MTTTAARLALISLSATLACGNAQALTNDEIAKYQKPDRQTILVEGAKKEGLVVYYTGMTIEQGVRPLIEQFGKKYPGVKLEYWRGDVSQMMQKILAERRAGKPIGDLAEGGNVAMHLNKASMAQAFMTPESKAYGKDYIDPAGTWVTTRLGYYGTAYNTKMVKEAEAPRVYDDLLDPKWKDKIAWRVGAESGDLTFIMNLLLDRGEKATDEYFSKLSQNNLVNYGQSANALVDRVGQGEYPLALNAAAHHPIIAQGQGAPVDVKMMDPIAITTMPLALIKEAPHPHAAMLLIDFLISRPGQEMLRDVNYFSALPDVEPIPEMRKITPKFQNMRANVIPPEAFVAKRDWLLEIEKKYFQ